MPASEDGPTPEPGSDSRSAGTDATAAEGDPAAEMRGALRAVRREGYKAAALLAAADGAACAVGAALLLALLGVDPSPPAGLPPAVAGALPPLRPLIAAAVGAVVAAAGFGRRVRAPLIERFEGANPEVREALRTARDAVRAGDGEGADNPVAAALYRDVIDRLGETSGAALVDGRRLAGTVLATLLLGVALVHLSAAGVTLVDVAGDGGAGGPDGATEAPPVRNGSDPADVRLRSGEAVMGDATNVSSGRENLSAAVSRSGAGTGSGGSPTGDGATRGIPSSGDIDAQRAGYGSRERIEEAELVREYATSLQEEDTDD